MSVDFRHVTWRGQGGLTLYARDYGEANAKLPVVCIPGLTRNARDFEEVAPWIAAQGRRVLVVDLRGRGRSERETDPRRYHPRIYADDVTALLATIRVKKAVFVGTSLGGLVTMTLAARRPHLIGGAVLNDVGPRIAKAGLARIRSYAGKSAPVETWADAVAYTKRINGLAFPDYPDAAWDQVARRLFVDVDGKPVPDYDPRVLRAANPLVAWLAPALLWAAFKRLMRTGPVLLVHGEISDIIDAEGVRLMKRQAPGLQVAAVPRVGHAPWLNEPAAQAALAKFFAAAP